MAKFFDEIPEFLIQWIIKQHIFWVATAPLKADGHVNVSPKGVEGTFHVVNSRQVWYEDLTGSGIETISHLRENGRITILFNAFEGPPRIARLFGTGVVHEFGTPEYDAFLPPEIRQPGSRAAIVIDVYQVGTSCGYAVPFYSFKKHRTQLCEGFNRKEGFDRAAEAELEAPISVPPRPELGVKRYWLENNISSLDGLPGLLASHDSTVSFVPRNTTFEKDDIRVMDSNPKARSFALESAIQMSALSNANINTLFIGFSLGVLTTAVYMRLMG